MPGQPGVTAAASRPAQAAPVIILGYPHSGGQRLLSLLSDNTGLACTSGTGLLPLCSEAAAVWRLAEDRDAESGQISALAAASIRAMVGAMVTQILARVGRNRWCEFAMASEQAAGTFVSLYPGARFVCLHRCFSDVARTAIQASPWGLANPGYAPFVAAYPASTLAALAAWWAVRTSALLAFEQDHPQQCLRVRYEDFDADQPGTASAMASFLGISGAGESDTASQTALNPGRQPEAATTPEPAGTAPEPPIPVAQLPPALLAEVNDLLRRLGYPPLTS
jgi:protein-tyrosine sulfotransferase